MPYDPLQQLAYFAVVFLLAPLLILTGPGMSPALEAQFPWYARLFGGRQGARSLHFLGLLAFIAFTVEHMVLVVATGFSRAGRMILGTRSPTRAPRAVGLARSPSSRRSTLHVLGLPAAAADGPAVLGRIIRPVMRALAGAPVPPALSGERSRPFPANGVPPEAPSTRNSWRRFHRWRLDRRARGYPLCLTLDDLGRMAPRPR